MFKAVITTVVMALSEKQKNCSSDKTTTVCGDSSESLQLPTKPHSRGCESTYNKVLFTPPTMCRLTHVLPKGFVRIRHYGILSCRSKKEKMDLCRKLLNCIQYLSQLRNKTTAEKLMILYKKDICKCEACGGNLISIRLRGSYTLTG